MNIPDLQPSWVDADMRAPHADIHCVGATLAGCQRHQRGATVVEFALIILIFLAFLFAVIEMARLMFLFNTLQEVTRRSAHAAAVTDPANTTSMDEIRQRAIFRSSPGGLSMMAELTDQAIRIDYLSVSSDTGGLHTMHEMSSGSLPSSPAENRRNCAIDPYAANCVRLVRARVCDPHAAGACEAMKMKPLLSFFNFEIALPKAETIARTQSFGVKPN